MSSVDSSELAVWQALEKVVDPCSIATGVPINLVAMGLVKEVRRDGQHVYIALRLTSPICWQAANILSLIKEQVSRLDGVASMECEIDPYAEWTPDMIDSTYRVRLRALRPLPEARAQ
jgi:metal-sulfur cluster biosynthetic enzyme